MKKITVTIIIALLFGFTSCNAQIPTDYLGKYKASLDSKNLLATLADPASDTSTASSVTVKRINGSPDVAEFPKEAQRKAQELIDSYTSKGYILDSSSMSMKTKAYGIITIKRNSIENENPMTKKTEVLYRWKDSDVSCLESGYSIKTYEGTTITLERINATDIRIPELYLILSSKLMKLSMRKFMILMAAIVVTMMPSIAKASTTVGVTVSNITDNSATVVFDKSESDYGYYAMIDRNNSVSEMVQNYANMGITKTEQEVFEMFVSQYPSGFLYLADTTLHITGLNAGTEIPIYTISIDNAGELTGTFGKTVFETTLTTGGTGLAEIGLSITDVTSYGCHLETSMNDQTAYFYFTAGKTATFVNHNLTDAESVLNYLMDNNWETWNHDLIGSYGTSDEPLSANTEYQVWLFPFNQNRELGTPTSQTFTTLSSSGIDDADVIQVSIYPNPVRNLLTVKNAEVFSRAELYNAAGQLMLRQSVQGSSCILDVSNLKRGGYYLLLTGTKGTATRKVIVE